MPRIQDPTSVRHLAFLYIAIAHRSDDYMSDAELETVTRMLMDRTAGQNRAEVQPILMDALDVYMRTDEVEAAARDAARHLLNVLTTDEREAVLGDLKGIAQADGVMLDEERNVLYRLADAWGLDISTETTASRQGGEWGVLHDLAYIYLVLAHGTDNDLTGTEVQVMLNKLREWQPDDTPADMRAVLAAAMEVYSHGEDQERLDQAISSVRDGLPREKRMAAMNDLVKIANADGVFLDTEEDLINHLLTEWDVDPFANYGSHGSKE